jgi:hypothetical protein
MIRVVHSGSRIRMLTFYPSRIQGSKRHRIPDPDPQHCVLAASQSACLCLFSQSLLPRAMSGERRSIFSVPRMREASWQYPLLHHNTNTISQIHPWKPLLWICIGRCGSESSFLSQGESRSGSKSREPNQCGSGSWSDFKVTKSRIFM